jgi:hypothetical protein
MLGRLISLLGLEPKPFGVFRKSPPLHFYMLQCLAFAYMLYRLLSRDYSIYGVLPSGAFDYPRTFILELWPPRPLLHWSSFQFIYSFIPRPDPSTLKGLQWIAAVFCVSGLLGILPRLSAWIAFAIVVHLTGMMQASNSELDGGSLALVALLIVGLSSARAPYRFGRPLNWRKHEVDCHWPIFLLFMFVGAFYTSAGLNKIIDVGLDWPMRLHLERLAARSLEASIFLTNRYVHPGITALHQSEALSVVAGFITLIGEVGFISILFLPRWRLFFATSMAALHVLVYMMAGINFVGSSAILFLCLDWNVVARRAKVNFDPNDEPLAKRIASIASRDRFGLLEIKEVVDAKSGHLVVEDEHGDVYVGARAWSEIYARCPRYWPRAALYRLPIVGTIMAEPRWDSQG